MYFAQTLTEALAEDAPGAFKLNVANTPMPKAYAFAKARFEQDGKDLDKMLPEFDRNYTALQKLLRAAPDIKRIDMPVIEPKDMAGFQQALASGNVDIVAPYARGKFEAPRDMTPAEGSKWVTLGKEDGQEEDDVVKAEWGRTAASKLKPTQSEIWFDKIIEIYLKFGLPKGGSQATELTLITSKEGFIIDGHHRWAQVFFADPSMTMSTLRVPLNLDKLLAIGRAYGAAIGNKPKA